MAMISAQSSDTKGFALLVAVIFMSVMLTFGIVLGALGYKQSILASTALSSQAAFYSADSLLECALYADQKSGLFVYNSDSGSQIPTFSCEGASPYATPTRTYTGSGSTATQILTYRFSLESGARCADLTVYKPSDITTYQTYIFSQGYNVSCGTVVSPGNARFVSRGILSHFF